MTSSRSLAPGLPNDGEQLGQGRENVRKLLKDNPELTEELQYKVLVKLGIIDPEARNLGRS